MFTKRQRHEHERRRDGEVSERMQRQRTYEDALIGQAQAGDAAAFASLFEQYHGPITTYLYHLTGDRDAADDLAQETFIKAYRALGRADPQMNVRAWLYRIATNTARSWQRHRRLLTWLPFGPGTLEPAVDAPSADTIGERELIEAALRRIGPRHAGILLLRHHQRLSLEETATALGISANTAKVRLFRARKAFVAAYEALATGTGEIRR